MVSEGGTSSESSIVKPFSERFEIFFYIKLFFIIRHIIDNSNKFNIIISCNGYKVILNIGYFHDNSFFRFIWTVSTIFSTAKFLNNFFTFVVCVRWERACKNCNNANTRLRSRFTFDGVF